MAAVEQQVLRALLACLDTGAALQVPAESTDDLVLRLARHHRISPAIAALAPAGLSERLADEMRRDRFATLGRSTLLRHAAREAIQALTAARIDAIVLKGIAYEDLAYPAPGTRPATDLDLLVVPAARGDAFAALADLGYGPVSGGAGFDEPNYHEVTLRRGDVNIDLHFALAPLVRCAIDYRAIWSSSRPLVIDGVRTRTLGSEHTLVNHALHMAIHHFDVPALYVVDLARLTPDPAIATRASEVARTWGCLRPWQTAAALTARLMPSTSERLVATETATWVTKRVVASFGGLGPVSRPEQLVRKVAHFDRLADVARYTAVQTRRKVRERLLGWFTSRTPAERLAWRSETAADLLPNRSSDRFGDTDT